MDRFRIESGRHIRVTSADRTGGSWCVDSSAAQQETCEGAVSRALHLAIEDLVRRQGSDMSRWRWDVVHRARFPHQGLDGVFGLGRLLSRSAPSAGDWSTVNVGSVATDSPYDQISIASYRQIIDLSPANDSRFIDAVGQSGHPQSPHYDDFLSDWHAVKHRRDENRTRGHRARRLGASARASDDT